MSDVVAHQTCQLLERQRIHLEQLDSIDGLERWRKAIMHDNVAHLSTRRCVPGSSASEPFGATADAQSALASSIKQWENLLTAGLERMRDNGVLQADTDPAALATGIMAALQGGYLLARTARDITPMKIALDMAIDRVKAWAARPG